MRRKKGLFSLFLVVTLCSSALTVHAKDTKVKSGSVIRESTFSSDDKDFEKQKGADFPATIKFSGKHYKLNNVSYDIIDKKPVTVKNEVEKVVDSDLIPENTEYKPEETLKEDNVTYRLKNVEIEEKTASDTYIQAVSGYTDYDYEVSRADVPATKNVTVINKRSGESETVTCNLNGIEQIGPSGWEDTYIDIVFESYDAQIFFWNGVTVTKDTSSPLEGHEDILLSSVGANNDNYNLIRTYWTGEAYEDANGVLCRNARADVQRKVNYYRANYSGEIRQAETPGYIYHATYTGTKKIASENQYTYTVKATAEYEKIDNRLLYALTGVSGFLIICVIVLILYIISKKKKEDEPRVQYVEQKGDK